MAPIKNGGKGNGNILNYFKGFTIPPSRWVNNDTPQEEIAVATSSSARSTNAGSRTQEAAKGNTPQRKRRQPPKSSSPLSSVSRSSASSNGSIPRKRGRPKKSESQQMRDDQFIIDSSPSHANSTSPKSSTPRKSPVQDSHAKFNINPVEGQSNIDPTKDSPYRSPSQTPSKRRVIDVISIPSSSSTNSTKAQHEVINISSSSFTQPQPDVIEISSSSSATKPIPPADMAHQRPVALQNHTVSPSKMGNALSNTFGARPETQQSVTPSSSVPPAASLGSISALTTAPTSSLLSGGPIGSTASKRRVTRDGLQAVKDSDDEDSSSGDELPSWQSFVKPKPKEPTPPPAKRVKLSPPEDNKPVGKLSKIVSLKTTPSKQATKMSKIVSLKTSPKSSRPKYRNSLASLVAEQEQWQISRATVESLESSVAQAKQKEERDSEQGEGDATIDSDLLLDAAGSGSDEQERMIKALERTEALQDEEQFYFFLDKQPKRPDYTLNWTAEEAPWNTMFKTEESRSNNCTSGMVAEMVQRHSLPMNVTDWMATQLLYEPREALCDAYLEILRESIAHTDSVPETYGAFGILYCTRSLFPGGTRDKGETGLPPGLSHIIQVVQRRAPAADVPDSAPTWTCEAFTDLALMNVDANVRADLALRRQIATSIRELLDGLSDDSFHGLVRAAIEIFSSPNDLPPRVLYQAISSLPQGSMRAAKMRRELASACFSTTASRKSAGTPDWPRLILNGLESMPEFHISPGTDYRLLNDLVAVLEVATEGGWTDHSELVTDQPAGAWGNLPPPPQVEREHNTQIDKICRRLAIIASKILDSGTSHMYRTEAKTSIERLVVRLENVVRARPKPKKSVFGGLSNEPAFQRSFKQATFGNGGFVKKEKPGPPAQPKGTPVKKKAMVSFTSSPPIPTRSKQVTIVDEKNLSDSSLTSLDDDGDFHTARMDVDSAAAAASESHDSKLNTPKPP